MTTTALQTKPEVRAVRDLLSQKSVIEQIRMVAPKHLTPERITRIAMTTIQRVPKLADCTPQSLLGALMTCTQLGLEPDPVSGRAYLIPYGKECTLIVGYRGMRELALRDPAIKSIEAHAVFSGDEFDYELGTTPFLKHKPAMSDRDDKSMMAVYAIAFLTDGGFQFEVMSRAQVDAIRSRSKASGSGPWVTDYVEMSRKTVVRRLCKHLPSNSELQHAVTIDEQGETGLPQDFVDVSVTGDNGAGTQATSKTDALTQRVAASQAPAGATDPPIDPPHQDDVPARITKDFAQELRELLLTLPPADANRIKESYGVVQTALVDELTPERANNLKIEVLDAKAKAAKKGSSKAQG